MDRAHTHPGTPHLIFSPSRLSVWPSMSPSPRLCVRASEWVTSATPHAAGTNRGITGLRIAFWARGKQAGRKEEVQKVSEPNLGSPTDALRQNRSQQIGTQRSRLYRSQCPQMTKPGIDRQHICRVCLEISQNHDVNPNVYWLYIERDQGFFGGWNKSVEGIGEGIFWRTRVQKYLRYKSIQLEQMKCRSVLSKRYKRHDRSSCSA